MKEAIKHGNWMLMHKDGSPVYVGETVTDFRGDQARITGGRPPHSSASTGRVSVNRDGETYQLYPTVFNLTWQKPRAPDTNAEYLAHGGTQCPFCGSRDTAGDEVNIEAGSAWQDRFCNDCSADWQDTYTLTGYATTNK
jgi:hypothetical protein